jgi:pyruvate dehydrogenase E1 component alpha subunit
VVQGDVKTPCHLYIGQEAVATGVCAALEDTDTIWGGHRSHGHYLAKGGNLAAMMAEIFCKATGCSGGRGGSQHLAAPDVGVFGTVPIVAATVPLAVGAALASKLRGQSAVSVTFFGDGCTEEGHVHESLNLASLHSLPVIFVCENNLYASHLRLLERRHMDNIHEVGRFYGIPSEVVDGNDVMAVRAVGEQAVKRARDGYGPTFLEFRTFRWRGHVGPSWDMDVGVKRRDELKDWLLKDPIVRARQLLTENGTSDETFEEIKRKTQNEVDEAVAFARISPYPRAEDILDHVFVTKTTDRGEPCEL